MHHSVSHGPAPRGARLRSLPRLVPALALAVLAVTADNSRAQNAASAVRQLAPGVLTTIPPDLEPDDTVSTHDLVEIRANQALQWKPEYIPETDTLYGMSDDVKFRREIWGLEFAFKPLRMTYVDLPTASAAA